MPLPCPHRDGYWTPPGPPNEELAHLFEHLGSSHYQEQGWVFDELASKMRDAGAEAPTGPQK